MSRIKTPIEIAAMRTSGQMLATVLARLESELAPGITTKELARVAARELTALGGQPAFLGYEGFPDVICISINEEVQHTIPGNRELAAGDIVNFDFGVSYDGMITDAGVTCGVGTLRPDAKRLLVATREALYLGIDKVKAGAKTGDLSAAIEARLRRDRLGIVEELVGHGVGHALHEDPMIPNYGKAGRGAKLVAGMTIAIEPIANLGRRHIVMTSDDWTIVTDDGSWSSQFEHTVLVTEDGSEILTQL